MDKYQLLFSSLQRLQAFPIDSTSVFETEGDLREYLKNNRTAYPGQIVAVNELQNVFIVISEENRLGFLRVGISDERVAEIATELDEKQYREVIEPVLERITSLIEKLQSEINEVNTKTTEKITDISNRLREIEKKIENGEIGGSGGNNGGGNCNCDSSPIDKEVIDNIFNDIHKDCGIVDELPVIEKIPLNIIESEFNKINGNCSGVVDNEEVVEPIPANKIDSLFNNINKC